MNEEKNGAPQPGRKKKKAFAILGTIVIVGLVGGFLYRGYARTHLKTDDAFIEGAIHLIASRVPGTVSEVLVKSNQIVNKGDLLVKLDPEIYSRKLAEAEAGMNAEIGRLSEFKAQVEAQRTRIAAARAAVSRAEASKAELEAVVEARKAEVKAKAVVLEQAEKDLARASTLLGKDVIPQNRHEKAATHKETAQAVHQAAQDMARQANIAFVGHDSTIKQVRAALRSEKAALVRVEQALVTQAEQIKKRTAQADMARLNLSYADIMAPADGFVTRKSLEIGNQLQVGQPTMAVVSLDDAHIIANYKETRIEDIKPGQKVKIHIDAYPGKKFTGRVDSIMAGAGSAFTLFPPENASGNYVKIVQRVPVKIVFDNLEEIKHLLRVGLSVEPVILVESVD